MQGTVQGIEGTKEGLRMHRGGYAEVGQVSGKCLTLGRWFQLARWPYYERPRVLVWASPAAKTTSTLKH